MTFQKGQSGNPNGRPAKNREFIEKCQQFTREEGLDILLEMARNKDDDNRFRAIQLLMSYGHGKPSQHMEVTGSGGGAVRIAVVYEDAVSGESD